MITKELSDLKYCDVNNLYRQAMSQKLPVNNFELIEDTYQFNEGLIKDHNEESDEEYSLEVDIQYPEKLYELYNGLLFLRGRMNIEKFKKFVCNLHGKMKSYPNKKFKARIKS